MNHRDFKDPLYAQFSGRNGPLEMAQVKFGDVVQLLALLAQGPVAVEVDVETEMQTTC